MTTRTRYILTGSIGAPIVALLFWLGVWHDVEQDVLDIPGEIVPWERLEDVVVAFASIPSEEIVMDSLSAEAIDEEAIDAAGVGTAAEGRFIARRREIYTTRLMDVGVYPGVEAPEFYVALGQFSAEARPRRFRRYRNPDERLLLVFSRLDHRWRRRYRRVLHLVPLSVCVLDFAPGEFHGAVVEDFVRAAQPSEVVFSWGLANNMDTVERLNLIVNELKGSVEYAKRGNPNVFVWVTVCGGAAPTANAWAEMVRDIPFDGVALWNVHSLPVGWKDGFLEEGLNWCRDYFGDRPVALAGLYGAKVWISRGREEVNAMREHLSTLMPEAYAEIERVGFAAVWRQIGIIPDRIFPAARY